MEQQILDRLSALEKMVADNNHMLRKIQRRARAAAALKIVYWLILIGLGVISISLIKPYIDQLKDMYSSVNTQASDYSELLKSLNQ